MQSPEESVVVSLSSENLDIAKTPKHAAVQFATNLRTRFGETTNMNPIDPPESGNDKFLELWTPCKEMRLESRNEKNKFKFKPGTVAVSNAEPDSNSRSHDHENKI